MRPNQRQHLEGGIYRKRIDAAYFDSIRAGMVLEEAVREAVGAGVVTLLSNRGVELRGLRDKDLREIAWKRIQPGIVEMQKLSDPSAIRKHTVSIVTRVLTDVAFEFWNRRGGGEAV